MENRPPEAGNPLLGPAALRVALAICQAVAIGLTWRLWQVRTGSSDAPNLPIVVAGWLDAIQFDFGWLLLASLLVAVIRPAIGVISHCCLIVLAIAFDQMRIQPEFVSVAVLLVGTLPGRGPRRVARCHLIALWFWAGLHKLLSSDYLFDSGPRIWNDTIAGLSHDMALGLAIGTAVFELLVGVLAAIPRTRRLVPWLAGVLHLGILFSLIVQHWNYAVWPWNVAVIVAAAEFFGKETGDGGKGPGDRRQGTKDAGSWKEGIWSVAAVIMLLHPGLYYLGLADGYLSWCVYASNTPEAMLYPAGSDVRVDAAIDEGTTLPPEILSEVLEQATGEELQFRHYGALSVPFSPASRLYVRYFRQAGQPGEMLVIRDSRSCAAWRHREQIVLVMTAERTVVAW